METGGDGDPGSYKPQERDYPGTPLPDPHETLDPLPRQRPMVVTMLAVLTWASSAYALLFGIVFMVAPRAVPAMLRTLDPWWHPDSEIYQLDIRLLIIGALFICALLNYLIARGLWRLRNWGRCVVIAFCVFDLVPSRRIESSALWPLSLWARGPVFELLSLCAALALVLYLLSPKLKAAFGVSGGGRAWQLLVGTLALVSIGISLSRSAQELNAIKWHLRHGNQISMKWNNVSGVPLVCPSSVRDRL